MDKDSNSSQIECKEDCKNHRYEKRIRKQTEKGQKFADQKHKRASGKMATSTVAPCVSCNTILEGNDPDITCCVCNGHTHPQKLFRNNQQHNILC